ncbi:hypothetical protein FOZ62_021240, partial [Perkinsus olseni]
QHCSSGSSSPDHREEKAQKSSPRAKKARRLSDGASRTSSVDMMRAKLFTSFDETTQMFQSNLSEPPPPAAVHRPLGGSQSSLPAEGGAEVEGPSKPIVAFSPPEVVEVADEETDANEKPSPVKSALESLAAAYTVALQPKQTTSTGASSSRYGQRGTVRSTGGKSLVDRGQTLTQLNVEAHAKSLSLDDTSSKPVLGNAPFGSLQERLIEGSGRWVVYPDGRFRLTWDVAGLLFIVYQGFVVPYTLSFETELRGFLADMDKCIDLYFMSDIALNFVTGYWNRGVLSLKHRDIARYYAQTWLLVDLVASIPFSWFISPDTDGPSQSVSKLLRVIRIVKFIRIARLLRLMRLKTLLSKLEEHIDSDIWLAGFTMTKMFLGLFVLSHWIACIWWSIGVATEGSETNWIRDNDLEKEGLLANKYLRSLFYAISIVSTMYGDIIASNDGERIFTMFAMLAAGVIFAVVVGSVTNLVVSFGEYKTEYRQRMKRAMRFMRANNVEVDLQVRIRRYIEHLLDNQFEFKAKSELMTMLSDSLQNEVQLTLMGKLLKRYQFFSTIREELVGRICMICKPIFCAPGDVVFYQGDSADGMSRSLSGVSALATSRRSMLSPTSSSAALPCPSAATKLNTIGPQEYVGEHSLFIEENHDSTGVCNSFTELMYLKRDDLREKISAAADALTLYLETKAVICLEKDHLDILYNMIDDDEVSPDAVDHLRTKDTLLVLAVRRNMDDVIEFLLNSDASVNVLSPVDRCTPLHVATRELNVKAASMLLTAGACPLLTDSYGDTPITYSTATLPTGVVRRKSLLVPAGTGAVASLRDDHSPNGHWAKSPVHLPNSAPKIFRRRTSGEVSGIQGLILEGSMEMDDEELLSKAQELRNMFAVALCKHGRLYEEDDNGQTREESE